MFHYYISFWSALILFINSCWNSNLDFLYLVGVASVAAFGIGSVATSGVGSPVGSGVGSCVGIISKSFYWK